MEYPNIIGVCGYATSGKDEIANILVENFGYIRLALADPLKDMATALGWDGSKDELPPCESCGMLQGRPLLQQFGTEAVRGSLGEDIWVNNALRLMDLDNSKYVIPDVRFPNEADILVENGARIWRVIRDGYDIGFNHASEASIDKIDVDATFFNSGTLEELEKVVLSHMDNYNMLYNSIEALNSQ